MARYAGRAGTMAFFAARQQLPRKQQQRAAAGNPIPKVAQAGGRLGWGIRTVKTKSCEKFIAGFSMARGCREYKELGKREYEDKKSVRGMGLSAEEGEYAGLFGPNGAGKAALTGMNLPGVVFYGIYKVVFRGICREYSCAAGTGAAGGRRGLGLPLHGIGIACVFGGITALLRMNCIRHYHRTGNTPVGIGKEIWGQAVCNAALEGVERGRKCRQYPVGH